MSNATTIQTNTIYMVSVDDICPAPENDKLYKPIDPSDPAVIDLANSILRHGVREHLVLTRDHFVISGHRRLAAAKLAGLGQVPARYEPLCRIDDPDWFMTMLREHNRQRVKSADELLRESVIDIDPEAAYLDLLRHRKEKSVMSDFSGERVQMGDTKGRKRISRLKRPMLDACIQIIEEHKKYLPISLRQIHYCLLNDPPLTNANKPGSAYKNTLRQASDLSDLITRARISGEIDIDSIDDDTRPVVLPIRDREIGGFIAGEVEDFLCGYRRDLLQSQPNHVELLCEKLALRSIIGPIATAYGIPMTLGRGFSSVPPRRDMARRFELSGKDRLILLVLADFDPDGITIGESFARSMRDDFGIKMIEPIRVALTQAQAIEYELPNAMTAKKGSATRQAFVEQFGEDTWELEALRPELLESILAQSIESVLDMDAYSAEQKHERNDAVDLGRIRARVQGVIGQHI